MLNGRFYVFCVSQGVVLLKRICPKCQRNKRWHSRMHARWNFLARSAWPCCLQMTAHDMDFLAGRLQARFSAEMSKVTGGAGEKIQPEEDEGVWSSRTLYSACVRGSLRVLLGLPGLLHLLSAHCCFHDSLLGWARIPGRGNDAWHAYLLLASETFEICA